MWWTDESMLPCKDFTQICVNYLPNFAVRITISVQFDVQSFSSSNMNEALESFGETLKKLDVLEEKCPQKHFFDFVLTSWV